MYVSEPSIDNNHLIVWAAEQAKFLGYRGFIYTLEAVIESQAFFQILRGIDDEYFGLLNSQQHGLEEIYKFIETFLIKQCGKRIKIVLRNQLLTQCSIYYLFKTIIYCCLHSKKKQQYISRILNLDQQIQTELMNTVQEVNQFLLNVVNQEDILLRVEQLQLQAESLKNELGFSSSREQIGKKLIQQLQQQLKKTNKQLKQLKDEKQKVIQKLELSNFDQYLSIFQRIQQENRILTRYVQELQESNNEYEKNQKQLRRDLDNQSIVIVDLNDSIILWKQKFNTLKMQNSFRFSFDDTFDHSQRRSFGTQIVIGDKQNTNKSKKNKGRVTQSIDFLDIDDNCSFEASKLSMRQQGLLEQMRNLRKYNEDLVHKLDTVYKTINNLTVETSQLKEKNEVILKENKFYKKQIHSLRRLQQKMQQDLLCGRI